MAGGAKRQIKFGVDYHPEFEGYVWEVGKGIYISFIMSKLEGKGNFRRYLQELKEKYEFIKIPTPSNRMRVIAKIAGFTSSREFFEEAGEWGEVLIWQSP